MKILHNVMNDLHEVVSGQSFLDESLFNVNCFISSCDVFLLPWIDATIDGDAWLCCSVMELILGARREKQSFPRLYLSL